MSAETHPLLALQAAETLLEQLRHRREHLPELAAVAAASRAVVEWEQRRAELLGRIEELQRTIDDAERRAAEIDVQRARLEAQLRTVIAPREAEALQSEIAGLRDARSGLDDLALEALEEQSSVDDELVESGAAESEVRATSRLATESLDHARRAVDAESEAISGGLDALRQAVPEELLRRYDRLRVQQVVAAARLDGARCTGCHLDLSAAELGEVRAAAAADASGVTDCPHCSRMLVI